MSTQNLWRVFRCSALLPALLGLTVACGTEAESSGAPSPTAGSSAVSGSSGSGAGTGLGGHSGAGSGGVDQGGGAGSSGSGAGGDPSGGSGGVVSAGRPNVIFVFADDLGYGDLGVYGSTSIATPHLDRLASEGLRFTQFYSGNAICTPSRAVLLTGRYGARQILPGTSGVYFPEDTEGMSPEQLTIAEVLGGAGYRTALIGKWHLGHTSGHLPIDQGFDYFWGLPYSNDMTPLPLMENDAVLEQLTQTSDQNDLTARYTAQIKTFMRSAHEAGEPFYINYTNNFPHVPLAASAAFRGTNPSCEELGVEQACGSFADVVSELDWSVNELVQELEVLGIARNTYIFFTSDNGPWLTKGRDGGSAGLLRNGKNSTFEGGFRVPMIVWGPGVRKGAVEDSPAAMIDWLPTLAALAGAVLPDERVIDGFDLSELLAGAGPRAPGGEPFRYIYYRGNNATPGAYREGQWKFKAASNAQEGYVKITHGKLLFDLEADPGETNDLATAQPARVQELEQAMLALDATNKADPLR